MKFLEFNSIFVIESLGLEEKKTGTELFNDIIRRGLMLQNMEDKCLLLTPKTKKELFDGLEHIRRHVIYNFVNPIIHFEAHGSKDGICLADNECITWTELQMKFVELNFLCENNLFITMATCYGGYIYKTISPRSRSPFWGFVGPFDEVGEIEVLLNFSAFYEEFLRTYNFNAAVNALNNANSNFQSKFKFQNAGDAFEKAYENYEKKFLKPNVVEQRANILACQAMHYSEFKNWSFEKVKEFFTNIIVNENPFLKKQMMTRFFSWDIFPEQKPAD